MAKKIYVGVSSKARNVKSVYVGVSGKARKVKKIYVGVGGVARQVWPGGLTYYGTATTGLKTGRAFLAGKSFGSYAVFGGGCVMNSTGMKEDSGRTEVEAFNSSLTRTLPTALGVGGSNPGHGAAKVGNYLLIGGASTSNIYPYNTSLTQTSKITSDRNSCLAGENSSYAFFTGSSNYPRWVNAFNSSLTKQSRPTSFSGERGHCRGGIGQVGSYAIFAGGLTEYEVSEGDVTGVKSDVDAINTSLTITKCTALSSSNAWMASATLGTNVAFLGGCTGTSEQAFPYGGTRSSKVETYNSSLTKTVRTALSSAGYCAAAAFNDKIVCVNGNGNYTDIYDTSFTKSVATSIGASYQGMAAGVIGNKALFVGGCSGSTNNANVYVYTN